MCVNSGDRVKIVGVTFLWQHNLHKSKIKVTSLKTAKTLVLVYIVINKKLLTNLRRQVFSLRAPTHPAKLTMKITPPAITITREMFKITSYTVSTFTKPVACHLSTNAYNPTPINSPPKSWKDLSNTEMLTTNTNNHNNSKTVIKSRFH